MDEIQLGEGTYYEKPVAGVLERLPGSAGTAGGIVAADILAVDCPEDKIMNIQFR